MARANGSGLFGETMWPQIAAIVITIVVAALSYLQLSRQAPPIQPKPQREKKSIVVRIRDIPIERSKDGLRNDLMSLAAKDSELEITIKGIERLTFVRVNKYDACATALFPTALPQSELLRRLQEASDESSLQYTFDCDFYGITPLTDADGDTAVDIVAVPGLASHPIGTWRSSKPGNNNVWLRDFLPRDIPDARILLYGYDTRLLRSDSRQTIEDLSTGLLDLLSAIRRDQESKRRPIIFIGHSLGGLLVKECLLRAMKQKDFEPHHAIFQACCGLLLFGVPSHGLNNRALLSIVEGQPNVSLIRDLVLDDHLEPSAFLKRISTDFSERWGNHCPVVCFYETRLTSTVQMSFDGTLKKAGPGVSMVTSHSATTAAGEAGEPAVSFDVDHSGLVKFDSSSHDLYNRVLNRLVRLVDSAKDRLHQRHLDTLSPDDQRQWNNLNDPPYSAFRNSAKLPKPEQGTLEWLIREKTNTIDHDKGTNTGKVPDNQHEKVLNSDTFLTWRDAPTSSSLLVTAPPGSGKSVLSNFVLQHLERNASSGIKVIYYFCSIRGDEVAPNARSVLRSLILQLCEAQARMFRLLPSDWAADKHKFESAGFSKLLQVLEQLLFNGKHRQIYCVIDGLDVYQDPDMIELVDKLRQIWISSAAKSGTRAHLFCTSRPTRQILSTWGPLDCSRLRCNPKDIAKFIRKRVAQLSSAFTKETKQSIRSQLLSRSEQSFLWLDVVVRRIANLEFPTPIEVTHAIKDSSHDLYKLYEDLINHVMGKTSKATRILAMVVYARRPLTCKELQHAMAVDVMSFPDQTSCKELVSNMPFLDPGTITQALGTLLDVVEGKVFVIHQSLKDFFQQNHNLCSLPLDIGPKFFPAYILMKYLCLNHENRVCDYSLFEYASSYWYMHVDSENDVYAHEPLQRLLTYLLSPSPGISFSKKNNDLFSMIPAVRNVPRRADSIAKVSDIGWLAKIILGGRLKGIAAHFKANDMDDLINSERYSVLNVLLVDGDKEEFPISQSLAETICRSCPPHTMKLVLEQRRNEVNITPDMTLLAASNWQVDQYGAMITVLLAEQEHSFEITPEILVAVAQNNTKDTLETVYRLANNIPRITSQIIQEAMNAHSYWPELDENIMFLFDKSNERVKVTEDMLAAAARRGKSTELLEFLLSEADDDHCVTQKVIISATYNYSSSLKILELLFSKGAHEMHITNKILSQAARQGGEVLELLLQKRRDETPLTTELVLEAAKSHTTDALSLLYERYGRQIEITSQVVMSAAKWGSSETLRLIFDLASEDIPITSEMLAAAASNNTISLGVLLSKRTFPITEEMLLVAIRHELYSLEIFNKLVSHAENNIQVTSRMALEAVDSVDCSLLSNEENLGLISALLDHNPDIISMNHNGWTMMVKASAKGDFGQVSLLLERGANPGTIAPNGWSPLALASSNGHHDVVELLLQAEANPNLKLSGGVSALSEASERGHLRVVELLLCKGANPGASCLRLAYENGHFEVARLLLEAFPVGVIPFSFSYSGARQSDGRKSLVSQLRTCIGTKDLLGRTGIWWLAAAGDVSVLEAFAQLKIGALDEKDAFNISPLSAAARRGRVSTVRVLLTSELVDTESQDCLGKTALWWAIKHSKPMTARLIANGLDEMIGDKETVSTSQEPDFDWLAAFCDICLVAISRICRPVYCCNLCAFREDVHVVICEPCQQMGGHCLDPSHDLVFREDYYHWIETVHT